MLDNTPCIIVPLGIHLLELLKYNPRNVVAVIDARTDSAVGRAGLVDLVNSVDLLSTAVYRVGIERRVPLLSFFSNQRYYQKLAAVLDECLQQYPGCRFILTANYKPYTRFIIDYVGAKRVDLWEDGLNHYLQLESLLPTYRLKELIKMVAGFYRGGLFDSRYRHEELTVYDRFDKRNLTYPIVTLKAGQDYYIGQPLIEDSLIKEKDYCEKLTSFFKGKKVIYLPHPREQARSWLSDVFIIERPACSAEAYLIAEGASAVYSAFSTVNVNIDCKTNQFLARYLGLNVIAERLAELEFPVTLL